MHRGCKTEIYTRWVFGVSKYGTIPSDFLKDVWNFCIEIKWKYSWVSSANTKISITPMMFMKYSCISAVGT